MDLDQDLSTKTVEEILSYIAEPIVFKNVLCTVEGSNSWKLLNWTFEELAEKCGNQTLTFRVGQNAKTKEPQWDTRAEAMTLKTFLGKVDQPDSSKWFYFDYKDMDVWFRDNPEIYNALNWSLFGLNYSGDNSTIWIGSKGAHTNCHQDTYGSNLVAQTHGRKFWMLFSPDCNKFMQPTRFPYEESTIYSKFNFFAPSKKEMEAIKNMPGCIKIITLEPKDVLFIPKGWWHYVECLDTSMSINIWLPMKEDCEDRLKEALTGVAANIMGEGLPKPINQELLNWAECLDTIQKCLKECQSVKQKDKKLKEKEKKKKLHWSDTNLIEELKKRYPDMIQFIPNLTSENMESFIKKNNIVTDVDLNTERNEVCEIHDRNKMILFQTIVDAFSHPDVISIVAEVLTKKFIQ